MNSTLQNPNVLGTGKKPTEALEDVAVLHPVLLALCPVLSLFANNAGKMAFSVVIRPALILALLAELLFLVAWLFLRERHRAGAVASTLIMASTWGWVLLESFLDMATPVLREMPSWMAAMALAVVVLIGIVLLGRNLPPGKKRLHGILLALTGCALVVAIAETLMVRVYGHAITWVLIGYFVLIGLIIRKVLRLSIDYRTVSKSANWFGAILLALYAVLFVICWPRHAEVIPPPLTPTPSASSTPAQPAQELPDIYVIALNGYARSDILQNIYIYNNAPFLDTMRAKGFEVAEQSSANYTGPVLSTAALLNMDYLHNLLVQKEGQQIPPTAPTDLFHNNRFRSFLRDKGYTEVFFSPGVQSLEPPDVHGRCMMPAWHLNEFEVVLLDDTIGGRFMQAVHYARFGPHGVWSLGFRRARIRYAREKLGEVAGEDATAPRFIFAYLPIPDAPFIFHKDGSWVDRTGVRGFIDLYRDQLYFTSGMLDRVTSDILENSKRPPVIIITSSHSPVPGFDPTAPDAPETANRFANLLMVYCPDQTKNGDATLSYNATSLVNVLRITLNRVFDAGLPLLEDQAYVVTEGRPYDSIPVEPPSLRE